MTRRRFQLSRTLGLGRSRALRLIAGIVLLATAFAHGRAQTDADEYDIRAAMLFNITRFVEWPASKVNAQHPQIVVCIAGSDPIGPSFDHFLESQNNGKPIKVRHLNSIDSSDFCHVLYVSLHEQKNLKKLAPELAKNSVLVISERQNANSPDQTIGLPTIDEHVHIEVNLGAAKRAGITISSKLLRLATVTR